MLRRTRVAALIGVSLLCGLGGTGCQPAPVVQAQGQVLSEAQERVQAQGQTQSVAQERGRTQGQAQTQTQGREAQSAEAGGQAYSSSIVAYINGEAIDEREFGLLLSRVKAQTADYFQQKYGAQKTDDFWQTSVGGEVPLEKAKAAALQQLGRIKAEQLAAQREGWLDDLSYAAFLRRWTAENGRRQEALKRGEPIYGPKQYEEWSYYLYVQTNVSLKLKALFRDREPSFTEQELRDAYERLKSRRYLALAKGEGERAEEKRSAGKGGDYRPYDEVRDDVAQRLLDERYESEVTRWTDALDIRRAEPAYSRMSMP